MLFPQGVKLERNWAPVLVNIHLKENGLVVRDSKWRNFGRYIQSQQKKGVLDQEPVESCGNMPRTYPFIVLGILSRSRFNVH